jgi:D-3-phosphoglycerate dehydrogenase
MTKKIVLAYAKPDEIALEMGVLADSGFEVIATNGGLVTGKPLTDPELWPLVQDASALLTGLHVVSDEMMAQMPNLELVTRVGTGYDAIDFESAEQRGIWVTNVPDYSIDEVSAHAIALSLALVRHLFEHRQTGQAGTWRYMGHTPIMRLSNLTYGVVGLGRIGKASARKAAGLGMSVIAYDPYIPQSDFDSVGAVSVDFETLMSTADIVSLHVPLNAETRGMIDALALSLMKPTAFLVNTARGPVVNVPALVAAVQTEQIAGAGIDVLPVEPCPVDDPVLHEPRIIVTPHLAASSVEAVRDVRIRGAEEALRVLTGNPPKYPVNEPANPRNAASREVLSGNPA